MSLTSDIEISIRKAIAEKLNPVLAAGFVIPAPIYFVDKADFAATVNNLLDTQKEIELSNVAFIVISLQKFEDSPSEGCADEPLVRLTYNFYFFRQYDFERADESLSPDEFLKKNLKSYNEFLKSVFDARIQFLGKQFLVSPDISFDFSIQTNSLVQSEFINENDSCRYIPQIFGHAADLQSVVEVLINEN